LSKPRQELIARLIELGRAFGRPGEVDADPRHRLGSGGFDEDAADLAVSKHQVVRPLEPDTCAAGLGGGHARGEAEQGMGREHERGQQHSLRRRLPATSKPAAPSCLMVGDHDRTDRQITRDVLGRRHGAETDDLWLLHAGSKLVHIEI